MTQPPPGTVADMTITEMDVQQLVHAIQVIYNSASTNADRQQAQLYCDTWKEDGRCPVMGHRLIAPTYPDQVRYFGLGLLESCVRFNWSRYMPEDKAQIRDLLVAVVSQLPVDTAKFIQEKAAHVFTELVERIWPHEWNGFHALLLTLAGSRPMTVCRILKIIALDTFVYANPLTQFRKEDLRNAMIVLMAQAPTDVAQQSLLDQRVGPAQLYQLCGVPAGDVGWMARLFVALQQSIVTGNETLAVCAIDAIAAYVDWLPLEVLIQNNVIVSLLPLLSSVSASVRMAACETIILILNRGYAEQSQVDSFLVDVLLRDDSIELIGKAWLAAGGAITLQPGVDIDEHLENDYPFLKRLAQLWIDFSVHICHKKRETTPRNLGKYMEFALILARHPSLYINTLTTTLWQNLLKHEYISRLPEVDEYGRALFEVCATQLNKSSVMPRDDDDDNGVPASLGSRYSFVDFEDSFNDFQVAAGAYRSQSYTILKVIVPRHTVFCLQVCLSCIRQVVSLPVPPPSAASSSQRNKETGLLTATSAYYLEWEAASALVHAVMTSLPPYFVGSSLQKMTEAEQATYTQSMTIIREMLQLSLSFTSEEPLVIAKQLDALTGFAEVLASEPNDQAFQLLQKVFSVVTFTLPNEPKVVDHDWAVSEDTIALRRKASASLLRLASGIANILMSIYPDIEREVNRLVQSQLIAREDKSFMIEFLVAIIHNATSVSPEFKQARYEVLFEPMITELLSDNVCSRLVSMESFMDAIGVTRLARYITQQKLQSNGAAVNIKSPLPDDVIADMKQCRASRQLLIQLVVAHRSCMSRTVRGSGGPVPDPSRQALLSISPWAVHAWKWLPTMLTMIKYLHSLWEDKWWSAQGDTSKLPAELSSLLEMSPVERQVILGVSMTEAAEEEHGRVRSPPATIEQFVHRIRNWLRVFREALYGTLNQASYLVPGDYFYTPQLAPALLTNVFGSVTSLNNNHWRSLVVFVRPLVLNCPPEHFADFLGQIIPPLATFLGNKLSAEWKQVVDSGLVLGTIEEAEQQPGGVEQQADTEQAQNEVLSQKILRDLTRGWVDILCQIFMPSLPELRKDKKKPSGNGNRVMPDFGVYNSLALFLLGTSETVEPLLYTMMYSMTWKDTKTCTQAARILDRLIPLLLQDTKFHTFYGKEVLFAALQALHDGYHMEGHDQLIGLITGLYILLRPKSTLPAETLASVVPSLATTEAISAFEAKLSKETQPASQRKVVKDALREVAGVKPGQWFRKPSMTTAGDAAGGSDASIMMKKIPDRLLLKKRMGQPGWHEAVDSGATGVDLGLLDLFRP